MSWKFTSKFLLFLAAFLVVVNSVWATDNLDDSEIAKKLPSLMGTSNVGREYWFSIPPCYEATSGDNFIRIFIISPIVTKVSVQVPASGLNRQFKTAPSGLVAVDIVPAEGQPFLHQDTQKARPAQNYPGKGIHIIADDPIVVYVAVRYVYTSDGFLAIPVSSLGKDYVVATSPEMGWSANAHFPPWVNITAAFDKTKVVFTMGGGNVQSQSLLNGGKLLKTGQTNTVTMNKGDVYVYSIADRYQDITGSRISANRPVSVVSGHFCNNIPVGNQWCDYTVEMELPAVSWGKNMIIPKPPGRKYTGLLKLFAKEPETDIYRNGTYFTTVKNNQGSDGDGFVETRVWPQSDPLGPRAAVLTSDKPFYAMFYNPGVQEDQAAGLNPNSDPFTMVMTPIEQYQHDITFCTPNAKGGAPFTENWVNVCVEADANGLIPDDMEFGTYAAGWQWQKFRTMSGQTEVLPPFKMNHDNNNPDSKFIMKNYKMPLNGVFRLRCASTKFASYSYGFGSYDSYGYPTSVALADLAVADIWPPIPKYTQVCDGENGMIIKVATVEDPLINGDLTTRSNLSDVYMKTDLSYNYDFKVITEITPGETIIASWQLTKINPREDARAVLTFIDKAGNDTTIIIDDIATKIDLAKDENYGNLKLGDPAVSRTFTITNNSKKIVTIDKLNLWKNTEGFKIEPYGWKKSDPMMIGESRVIKVTFTPDNNLPPNKKLFIDSIGVGDTCIFSNLVEIRASLGVPFIKAEDYNFGTFNIDATTPLQTKVRVSNPSTDADLTITGASALTNTAFTAVFNFPGIATTQDISPKNPIQVKAGGYFEYDVYFKPTTVGHFNDKIVFTADASTPDNESILDGDGIQSKLSVNQLDWGEYRINRPGTFPIPPKIGTENGVPVLTFVNKGSIDVNIQNVTVKVKQGDASSFVMYDTQGKLVPITSYMLATGSFKVPMNDGKVDGKVSHQIYFSPTIPGNHEVELTFDNDANIPTIALLKGIGIVPRIQMTPSLNYGQTVINDVAKVKNQTFDIWNPAKSAAGWEFGDTLQLSGFANNPQIGTVVGTFGTEGFSYDPASAVNEKGDTIPNLNTYRLAPGSKITVNGEFVAQKAGVASSVLVINSDAQDSNNVAVFNNKSAWLGLGLTQGLTTTKEDVSTCVNQVSKLNFSITNTGTDVLTISNFSFNAVAGLTLDDPAMYGVFSIQPGIKKDFTMTFNPLVAIAPTTVTISYNTNILTQAGVKQTIPFTVEAYDFTRNTSSEIHAIDPKTNAFLSVIDIKKGEGVDVGSQFGYRIILDPGPSLGNIDAAKVTDIDVNFNYPPEFIKPIISSNPAETNDPNKNSLMIGSLLKDKFDIDYTTVTTSTVGKLTQVSFKLKAKGGNVLNGVGELITLRFKAYLPAFKQTDANVSNPKDFSATITHGLSDNSNLCFEFTGPAEVAVKLNQICADPLRKIVLGGTYALQQVNPNPVGSTGANIDFEVGMESQTEINIYNSNNELVATVANGIYNSGAYSVAIPIEKLSTGTYFYEMKSGFFTDMKKLVIVK